MFSGCGLHLPFTIMRINSTIIKSFLLPILLVLTGCQKELCLNNSEITPQPIYTIPGGWQGKFGRDANPPDLPFAAHFKTDGKVTVEADTQPFILLGTWILAGDSVIANYTFPGGDSFRFAAKFVDTSNRISGYWGAIPPAVGGGTFFLQKN